MRLSLYDSASLVPGLIMAANGFSRRYGVPAMTSLTLAALTVTNSSFSTLYLPITGALLIRRNPLLRLACLLFPNCARLDRPFADWSVHASHGSLMVLSRALGHLGRLLQPSCFREEHGYGGFRHLANTQMTKGG